jgi:hypothetical protein
METAIRPLFVGVPVCRARLVSRMPPSGDGGAEKRAADDGEILSPAERSGASAPTPTTGR